MFDNNASSTIGSTAPILIASEAVQSVRPGRDYFFIQIIAAQAFFHGNFWSQTNRLVITSQVNLNHPAFGNQEVLAIQRSREVQHDVVVKLGLSPNLIALVPGDRGATCDGWKPQQT